MGKTTVKRGKQPPKNDKAVDFASINARALFVGTTLNLGWRLAITVIVPIVAGVKIDARLDSEPWYTLLGLAIAAAASTAAVWATVKEANAKVAELTRTNNTTKEKT